MDLCIQTELKAETNAQFVQIFSQLATHSGNYFVIVETIFFIQNFEFIEKITQKFH